jgi:DNA-binding HxlR family transcriptional regulator
MVILCLEDGPRRFSELRVPLRRATPKVLTRTLRALERDGMVTRTVYAEVPERVEYELTALGRSLLDFIAAGRRWADEHLPALLAARNAYEDDPSGRIGRARAHGEARPRLRPGSVHPFVVDLHDSNRDFAGVAAALVSELAEQAGMAVVSIGDHASPRRTRIGVS